MNKKVYVVETGTSEIEAKTGLHIFNSCALSSLGFESLKDAASWIESRYGAPKRIGSSWIWTTSLTSYRIREIDIIENSESKGE